MRRVIGILAIAAAIVGIVIGGYYLWDRASRVSTAELEQIVQRDAVSFEPESIPDEVLDRLAANRVVLIGEFHFLREHRELVAGLLRELHARGFRQYLFEWTQAADWLLADFVNDGGLMPQWKPPHDIGGATITAIRDLNRTLPEDEHIRVHAIDVSLQDYGGAEAFLISTELLAEHLPDPGPLALFLEGDHGTNDSHRAQLETLQSELNDKRAELATSWGEAWYDTVVEMVEVELRAIPIRAIRDSDYDESVRLREETIKWLADRRIGSSPSGVVINFGNTHAQKEGLWGTEGVEWLGDYLVHKSPAAGGSIIALWVAPSQIVSELGSETPNFDLAASPKNELLRVTSQTWPEQNVFLPLDDPLLGSGRIPVNMSGEIFVGAPQEQYDGLFLLPIAHRDFVGD
jgi:hypothetical protein